MLIGYVLRWSTCRFLFPSLLYFLHVSDLCHSAVLFLGRETNEIQIKSANRRGSLLGILVRYDGRRRRGGKGRELTVNMVGPTFLPSPILRGVKA